MDARLRRPRRSRRSSTRWLADFAGTADAGDARAPAQRARRRRAQIWLKREDLLHTGAHKLNNALGQVLLAQRMGKRRIIAETGAGQHGVATATACAALGLGCVVYMGREDMRRQALNVYKMGLLGAQVVPVDSGSATLKDATNEAIRDWVANVRDTHYVIGSAVGPHPYPSLVRRLQRVIGDEARAQMLAHGSARCPTWSSRASAAAATPSGSSRRSSTTTVRLVGVEAAGRGLDSGEHAAPLVARPARACCTARAAT